MTDLHPSREERERRYRRLLALALGASLVVHVILVVVISAQLAIPRRHFAVTPSAPRLPEGMRVIRLRETPSVPGAGEETRRPRPPETRSAPSSERPGPVGEEGGEAAREALTNAEKLQPRPGDLRIWEGIVPENLPARHLTGIARADSAVRAILQAYLDSVRVSQEARKRAQEWLVGKGDKKWGIASDGLHLGDIVIPIPFGQLFQATGEKGREIRQQLQDLEVIRYQDALDRAREAREERVKAMRKRSHEQAGETRPDTGSSGGDAGRGGAGQGGGAGPRASAARHAGADVARFDARPLDSPLGSGRGRPAAGTSAPDPADGSHPSPTRGTDQP